MKILKISYTSFASLHISSYIFMTQTSPLNTKIIPSLFKEILIQSINTSELLNFQIKKHSLYKWFFISNKIFGSLYEIDNAKHYMLATKWETYLITSSHFNSLVLQHYIYCLNSDILRFKEFQNNQKVHYSSETLDHYKELIDIFQNQCTSFVQKYQKEQYGDYDYHQNFRYLIASYASIRTILLWNAESLYDSINGNNFLLLGVEDLSLSSYARVKTWIIENQEHYIYNILDFPQRERYNISLTNSGMSAIELSIQYLISQKKKKILIFGTIYFETIKLLESYFWKENITFYDTNIWIDLLEKYLEKYTPDVIFADSMTLSFTPYILKKEDFQVLLAITKKHSSQTSIVLDITTKYTYLQDYIIPYDVQNDIIFVSSLAKYLYGGFDLGFWGYILYPKSLSFIGSLFSNSWAGIWNIDALKIPLISQRWHKELAKKRSDTLQDIQWEWEKQWKIFQNVSVVFPAPIHSTHWEDNFFWSLINIWYSIERKDKNMISYYKTLIVQKIMATAKLKGIELSYSTSYWYYNTRISVFSCESVSAIPIEHPCYVRISVGYHSKKSDIVLLIQIIWTILSYIESQYTGI